MKKEFKILLFTFLFILTLINLNLADASCFDIHLGHSEYLQGETFQAEITGDFVRPITNQNLLFIKLEDNTKHYHMFNIIKISPRKYFVYSDLTENPGTYKFSVRTLCDYNGFIGKGIEEKSFIIKKPLSKIYDWLERKISDVGWRSLSIEENSFALIALRHNKKLKKEGIENLMIKKSDNCWSSPCDIKETSLSLLALEKSGEKIDEKVLDWIIDSFNSINIGNYTLIVETEKNQTCDLIKNNITEKINLTNPLTNFEIKFNSSNSSEIFLSLECNENVNAYLRHRYKEISKNFEMKKEKKEDKFIWKLEINNKKCFGKSYKTECSSEATAYALYVLNELKNESNPDINLVINQAYQWLERNSYYTDQKSILYLIKCDGKILNWILNNQDYDGSWFNFKGKGKIRATSFALYSLENCKNIQNNKTEQILENAIAKAKNFLSVQEPENILDTSIPLALIFSFENIEPLIAIQPAIIKTKSGTEQLLLFKNKGIDTVEINFDIPTLQMNDSFDVTRFGFKIRKIFFPQVYTENGVLFDTIKIKYTTENYENYKTYEIPLILETLKTPEPEEQLIENITNETKNITNITNETIITNKTEIIINQTNITLNKTFLKSKLEFKEKEISETISDIYYIKLTLENPSEVKIKDIDIMSTPTLFSLITLIDPRYIPELDPGKEKEITIKLDPSFCRGTYEGAVVASGIYNGEEVSTTIPITIRVPEQEEEENKTKEETCIGFGGKICSIKEKCSGRTEVIQGKSCCFGKCIEKEKKKPTTLLIILLIIAVFLIIFMFWGIKKKPKKEMRDIIENIESKYRSRYPRLP